MQAALLQRGNHLFVLAGAAGHVLLLNAIGDRNVYKSPRPGIDGCVPATISSVDSDANENSFHQQLLSTEVH